MQTCHHGIPINMHCGKCFNALRSGEDYLVERLADSLIEHQVVLLNLAEVKAEEKRLHGELADLSVTHQEALIKLEKAMDELAEAEQQLAELERQRMAMKGACTQASFCIRELIGEHPDAVYTVGIINKALAEQPDADFVSKDSYMELLASRREDANKIAALTAQLAQYQQAEPAGTPSSQWKAAGEPDPHGDRYNCERAELAMGNLTDDELANGAYLNYDRRLSMEEMVSGKPMPIAWMTAVKDRIRWLSRKLEEASTPQSVAVVLPEEMSAYDFPEGHSAENLANYNHLMREVNVHNKVIAEVRRLNAVTTTVQELERLRADADEHQDARCFLNNILRLHHIEPVDGLDAKIEQVSELLERLRDCEQDAARYRWLREFEAYVTGSEKYGYTAERHICEDEFETLGRGNTADDAVDKAIQAIQASQSQGE